MYCKKCGIYMSMEESINYGMCEECFDEFLDLDEEITITQYLEDKENERR